MEIQCPHLFLATNHSVAEPCTLTEHHDPRYEDAAQTGSQTTTAAAAAASVARLSAVRQTHTPIPQAALAGVSPYYSRRYN